MRAVVAFGRMGLVTLALAATLPRGALAQAAGEVLSVSGPQGAVVGLRANATFPVTPGSPLHPGDLLLVGADASVRIAGAAGCQQSVNSLHSVAITPDLCTDTALQLAASSRTEWLERQANSDLDLLKSNRAEIFSTLVFGVSVAWLLGFRGEGPGSEPASP